MIHAYAEFGKTTCKPWRQEKSDTPRGTDNGRGVRMAGVHMVGDAYGEDAYGGGYIWWGVHIHRVRQAQG